MTTPSRQTADGEEQPAPRWDGEAVTIRTPLRRGPGRRVPATPATPASEASDGGRAGAAEGHEAHIGHIDALGVLVCLQCQPRRGLRPEREQLERHFRQQHKTKKDTLTAIVNYSYQYAEAKDPVTMKLPEDGLDPVAFGDTGPVVVLDGFHCRDCGLRTVSRDLAKSHPCGGRRDWGRARLQTLTPGGGHARYWVVQGADEGGVDNNEDDDGGGGGGGGGGSTPGALDPRLAARLAKFDEREVAAEGTRRRTVDGRQGVDFSSAWVRTMGWSAHLGDRDMRELHSASRRALARTRRAKMRDEEARAREERKAVLQASFDRVMARCCERLGRVPAEALRWLASIDARQPASRPFGLKQEEDTMDRYRGFMKQFLCYCDGAYRLGRSEAAERWNVRFTGEQWTALDMTMEALDKAARQGSPSSADDAEGEGEGEEAGDDDIFEDDGDEPGDGDDDYTPYGGGGGGGDDDETEGTAEDPRSREEKALDRRVFRFCVLSLKQTIAVNAFANPLIHFTAVLAIDGKRLSWRQPANFTPILAGILWCARVLLLEHFFEDDEAEDPNDMSAETVERFAENHHRWLADGSFTPVSRVIRDMTLGRGYRSKEGGLPRVIWTRDRRALVYLGDKIELAAFGRAATSLLDGAEAGLDAVTFGGWTSHMRDVVDMDRITDSLVFEGPGRSFVSRRENDWLQPGYRMALEAGASTLWDPRGDGEWRRKAVMKWLSDVHQLRQVLAPAMHIWGGQPGRGPEIMTVRHCDLQDMARNCFVYDGVFMVVTDRDKYKAIRGLGRKVARFLPPRLGRVMVAFIAWILPLETLLYRDAGIHGPSEALGPWLWKDARKGMWKTTVLTRELHGVTRSHIGVALGAADYRHVAVALGREIRGLLVQQVEVDMMEGPDKESAAVDAGTGEERRHKRLDFVFDLQSTHGTVTAQRHYAVNSEYPAQLPPEMVANYREVSRLWHHFLESWAAGAGPDEGESRGPGPGATPRKRGPAELARPEEGEGEEGCVVCQHDSPAKRRKVGEAAAAARGAGPGDDGEVERTLRLGLEALYGPGASWRSEEQHEATRWALTRRGCHVLIAVLPTGGGKSVLFMLPSVPAVVSGGVSIVVVPFDALAADLVDRAHEADIDCFQWRPAETAGRDGPARVARMVVVSADQAVSREFSGYAAGLKAKGVLKRIFVDECHTIITDASYRERLVRLNELYRYDRPVILLTATLPPRLEAWFRKVMLARDATIIRASTVKTNIRYRVITVDGRKTTVQQETAAHVATMTQAMSGDQKGVVYCRSIAKSKSLAETMGCGFYNGAMADAAKAEALAAWREGRAASRWIAATSGLGTGVDIKGIVAVLHMEQPYGLVDFIQQTGRGGRRDGETVDSVVIVSSAPAWFDETSGDIEQVNREAVERYIKTPDCRRVTIGAFMDGAGRECGVLGAEACDRCRQMTTVGAMTATEADTDNITQTGARNREGEQLDGSTRAGTEEDTEARTENRLQRHNKDTQAQADRLRQWLREAEGYCGPCFVWWGMKRRGEKRRGDYQHTVRACHRASFPGYVAWRRTIRFAEGQCCWLCGLPERWCEAEGGRDAGGCRWMDVVLPVVMFFSRNEQQRSWLSGRFGEEEAGWEDEEVFAKWLGRSRQVLDSRATNAFAVWVELVECSITK